MQEQLGDDVAQGQSPLRAVWVGGPDSGETMQKIRRGLAEGGVELVREFRRFYGGDQLPRDCDVVLFNHQVAGHGDGDNVKREAKKRQIPLVGASVSATETLRNLSERGFIKGARTIAPFNPPVVSAPTPTPTPTTKEDEPMAKKPKYLECDGVELTEEDGTVWLRSPFTMDGRMMHTKPILVGGDLFVSASDAARTIGVHKAVLHEDKMPDDGSGKIIGGFEVRYPSFDEAAPVLPLLIARERKARLGTPRGSGSSAVAPMTALAPAAVMPPAGAATSIDDALATLRTHLEGALRALSEVERGKKALAADSALRQQLARLLSGGT